MAKRKNKTPAERKPKAEPCDWFTRGMSRLERTPHVRRCLFCKEVLDMCAVAEDDYLLRAKKVIAEHIAANPEPDGVSCRYSGCIHHERLDAKLARSILRIGKGDKPWRDVRGGLVGVASLVVTEKNHPEGFDMTKQDVTRRAFKFLDDEAGNIYISFGPKVTRLHVWISLSYPTRHYKLDDPATIADVRRQFEETAEAVKKWCLEQYQELRGLAEMDVQFAEEE